MKNEIPKSVTAYLDSLVWDGVPRLNQWLINYSGAEDNAYVRMVSRKILVAAVRRARAPGCVFDQLPVLVGPQGSGKTSALRVLAVEEDWFTDDLPFGSDIRRCMEATDGKWIVEVSELQGIGRHRVAALKDFLSKTYDRARMPYAYKPEQIARQFVIIGTTNEMEDLRGAPENRRVWPVCIQRFDLVRLRTDRDQLWAEAAEAEALGESICLGAAEPDKL